MKKALRILLPVILAATIIFCTVWYLFVYDRAFTRDLLLSCARYNESQGNHKTAAWFYNMAYAQSEGGDDVAIELAQQYKDSGNYTKAEYTLYNAISDGAGYDVYVALSQIYVEQDKLLDAANMLASVTNDGIKERLDAARPAAPTVSPEPNYYSQYISVSLTADSGTIYYTHNGEYPSVSTEPYNDAITLVDGENTVQAITVGENGLVSPIVKFGYTVGGVIEVIEFTDDAIEAQIRSQLGVSQDKILYTNDLWTITEFTIPKDAQCYGDLKNLLFLESLTVDNGVSEELSFISSLSNLTALSITKTTISQDCLSAISALPMLKELTLSNCSLSGIASLEKAINLTKLDLSDNAIRNIDALSAMQNLQELNLERNALSDLSALSVSTALTKLDVSNNSLKSLAPVSTLTALTWVDAGTNAITELGDIGKLTALNYLSLGSNQLTGISQLTTCTAITELNISSNELTDISCLAELKGLMYLDFSYNQVTELPAFSANSSLVNIDGSHNLLTSLNSLGGLKSLNMVNMDYNEGITSVSALAKCPVLMEVYVFGTGVTDVTPLTNQCIVVHYNPVQ